MQVRGAGGSRVATEGDELTLGDGIADLLQSTLVLQMHEEPGCAGRVLDALLLCTP